jgi:hypothetical protein
MKRIIPDASVVCQKVPDVFFKSNNPSITDLSVDIHKNPLDIFLNFTDSSGDHDSVCVIEDAWFSKLEIRLATPYPGVVVVIFYPN